MRKGRVFFLIALILILGLVAVGFVYMKMLNPASPETAAATPTQPVDMVGVVVVAQRVPRGSSLNETVLSMVQIPRDLLIPGYFTDMGLVVGRQAKMDLEANMLLTDSMVVNAADQLSATGSIAALSIPKGMVAVSIPINRLSSVSYAPQAGDHVNVIASLLLVDLDTDYQSITPNYNAAVLGAGPGVVIGSGASASSAEGEGQQGSTSIDKDTSKITAQTVAAGPSSVIGRTEIDPLLEQTFYAMPSERQRPRLVTQTLLQDAIVLGMGNFPLKEEPKEAAQPTAVPEGETPTEAVPEEQTYDETGAPIVATPEPKLPDVITLIVTPQDAVTLNYLVYAGAQLTLALRPSGDDTRVQTEATTLDFLLKQYNIPVPVKLPYGMEPRIDELITPKLPNDVVPTPQP
jgi:pilus assembly protein CpaB